MNQNCVCIFSESIGPAHLAALCFELFFLIPGYFGSRSSGLDKGLDEMGPPSMT